jgi:hypothetical protein
MDGSTPRECICGSSNFERVVVSRPNGRSYTTEFLACAECRVMYFSPELPVEVRPPFVPVGNWQQKNNGYFDAL